ncbi:hypothetical protein [Bradyrhizobium sp. USDA 3256]
MQKAATRMSFDVQRTLRNIRAMHWRANARTHEAPPEIDQNRLRDARQLQLSGDYEASVACVQTDPNWKHDPRAWRLIGLCSQGLARYEADPVRRKELYLLSEKAAAIDRARRVTETAEADINLAASLLDQQRYPEALDAAIRARDTDPQLPTAHVAVLSVYNRQHRSEAVRYLQHLLSHESWIFESVIFLDHLATDPDLAHLSKHITSANRSSS